VAHIYLLPIYQNISVSYFIIVSFTSSANNLINSFWESWLRYVVLWFRNDFSSNHLFIIGEWRDNSKTIRLKLLFCSFPSPQYAKPCRAKVRDMSNNIHKISGWKRFLWSSSIAWTRLDLFNKQSIWLELLKKLLKSFNADLWDNELKCWIHFPGFCLPRLFILHHALTPFSTQAGSANCLFGPLGNNVQIKQ